MSMLGSDGAGISLVPEFDETAGQRRRTVDAKMRKEVATDSITSEDIVTRDW